MEKKKTVQDVKWNLLITAENALENELQGNKTISPERVVALTGLIEMLLIEFRPVIIPSELIDTQSMITKKSKYGYGFPKLKALDTIIK